MKPSLLLKAGHLLAAALLLVLLGSCKTTAPDKLYLDLDPELQMGLDAGAQFENYVFKIREGATPTGGDQSKTGCGCN